MNVNILAAELHEEYLKTSLSVVTFSVMSLVVFFFFKKELNVIVRMNANTVSV